jgi:hypothetical protein
MNVAQLLILGDTVTWRIDGRITMLNCLGAKYIKPVLIHQPHIIISISGRVSGQPTYRKPSPNQLFISCGGSFAAFHSVYLNRTRWCSCIVVFQGDLVQISATLWELHESKWKGPDNIQSGPKKCIHTAPLYWWVKSVYIFLGHSVYWFFLCNKTI